MTGTEKLRGECRVIQWDSNGSEHLVALIDEDEDIAATANTVKRSDGLHDVHCGIQDDANEHSLEAQWIEGFDTAEEAIEAAVEWIYDQLEKY